MLLNDVVMPPIASRQNSIEEKPAKTVKIEPVSPDKDAFRLKKEMHLSFEDLEENENEGGSEMRSEISRR